MGSYVVHSSVLIICMLGIYLMLRDAQEHPGREGQSVTDKDRAKSNRIMLSYSLIMTVLNMVLSVWFCGRYAENHIFNNLRCMLLLAILWPIAYIDYRTYRIPNTFILLGLIARAVMIPFELLIDSQYAKFSLVSGLIAAAAMLLAAVLCAVLAKGSIGFGDMKLFIVIGLYLEMEGSWGAMFVSLILSFVIAVVLMAFKKVKRNDSIPFGPAIMLGTYLSVCITGM